MGWVLLVPLALAVAALLAILWIRLSPWPGSMLIRLAFNRGARATSERLAAKVAPGVEERLGIRYDPEDEAALLDVFWPGEPSAGTAAPPVVVWIHGGAWISGRRGDIANYLRILAGRGIVAVGVDYSIAPESRYPRALRQVNAALRFLSAEARELDLDPGRFVLAGDSAGAQIAAQAAAVITDPAYAARTAIEPGIAAEQLRATLLCCGAYDLRLATGTGLEGWFLGTALWAYSGSREYSAAESFRLASVAEHAGPGFPPSFITAGNADPLLAHSRAMAGRLTGLGVPVEAVFFEPDHRPELGHEYQFDLDREEGREALDRMVRFATVHAGGATRPSAPAAPPA